MSLRNYNWTEGFKLVLGNWNYCYTFSWLTKETLEDKLIIDSTVLVLQIS